MFFFFFLGTINWLQKFIFYIHIIILQIFFCASINSYQFFLWIDKFLKNIYGFTVIIATKFMNVQKINTFKKFMIKYSLLLGIYGCIEKILQPFYGYTVNILGNFMDVQ